MKKKKIRILQVNKLYYPFTGGIEQVVRQIAEGLSDCTDMRVLVCSECGKTKDEMIHHVRICRAASIGMIGNLPIPVNLVSQLKAFAKEADIIQFHMPFPFGDLAGLLSGYHGKIVIWWHSDVVRQKKMMFFYKPIMDKFLKRADKIIVATEGHIEGSIYLQPYRNKCVVIPFGVKKELEHRADQYWAEYIKKERSKEEKYLLEQETGLSFLFVGRLVYYKGCDVLLEAFADLLRESELPHRLIMVGSGPMEKELRELAIRKGLLDSVEFTGTISGERLYQKFETCDVFVLPSVARSEAFGLVQIEAMAFGKPVINTRLDSGVPYVSLDKVTGLTIPPGDKKALKEAMYYMEKHPEERKKMGKMGRQRMKQEYREKTMLERLQKLYEELLEGDR